MNIIVIGDIMLDINHISTIFRKAPEADIPIYNIIDKQIILGGAGNIANNLKNLNTDVELISLVGNDIYGNIIKDILNEKHISHKLFIDNRITTTKNRIFNNNELSVRFDNEDTFDITTDIESVILEYIMSKTNIDAIIISDYNKGLITDNLCKSIIKFSNKTNIPTFVDPKINNIDKYSNCFLFKPNIIEAENIANETNIENIIKNIKNSINCTNLLITRGKEGMILNNINEKIEHNSIIKIVDVTGAGDVVLAVLVYCYLKYNDLLYSCKIANYIGGKSVEKIGNYTTNINDINEYVKFFNIKNNDSYFEKIIYDDEINKLNRLSLKLKNNKTVFTNGCFDILHSAHIELLKYAKSQGDILVVGLNSDESIKRLKGSQRPINNIDERSKILSLFDFIDYIVIFSDDTPSNILKILKPNILVKGGDYNINEIIGKEYVNDVILFDYILNKSSTNVIKKIKGL